METFSFTKAGGHIENQDAFEIALHPYESSLHLCAIADGQGGRAGGAEAAPPCMHDGSGENVVNIAQTTHPPWAWQAIVSAADQAVAKDPDAGFTTLIAFCLTESHVIGASNGDSAAVLFNSIVEPVILTRNQSKNPPVGAGDVRSVSFFSRLTSPWTLLAMTDGVWKYAGMDTVLKVETRRNGDEIIEELMNSAKLIGSGAFQDDFTIVVFAG
jgi:serine/threonine protein phosphatase PrpC